MVLVFLGVSCSVENRNDSTVAEVKINDGVKTTKNGEIVIDGTDSEDLKPAAVTARPSVKEPLKTVFDGSQISTMFDAFGNKTEIRTFPGNTLVQSVIARTFADGRREIFVYGQNGDARSLPEHLHDKVLTASGNLLANSAGIFTGRQPRLVPTPQEINNSQTIPPAPVLPVIEQPTEAEKPSASKPAEIIEESEYPKPLISNRENFSADLQRLELKAKKKRL